MGCEVRFEKFGFCLCFFLFIKTWNQHELGRCARLAAYSVSQSGRLRLVCRRFSAIPVPVDRPASGNGCKTGPTCAFRTLKHTRVAGPVPIGSWWLLALHAPATQAGSRD